MDNNIDPLIYLFQFNLFSKQKLYNPRVEKSITLTVSYSIDGIKENMLVRKLQIFSDLLNYSCKLAGL
jgi:hypothetical protein